MVGLLACLQRVLWRFISLFVGCGIDLNLNGLNGNDLTFLLFLTVRCGSCPQDMNND